MKVTDLPGELIKRVIADQTVKYRGFQIFKRLKNSYCYMYRRILHPLALYYFCVRYRKLVPVINAVPRKEGIRMLVSGFRREVDENYVSTIYFILKQGYMFRLEVSHLQALTTFSLPDALPTLGSHSVYSCGTHFSLNFLKRF